MEKENSEQPSKQGKNRNAYAMYSSLAIQMIVIIGGGSYLGWFFDEQTVGEFPIYTLILSLVSVSGSMYYIISKVKKNG